MVTYTERGGQSERRGEALSQMDWGVPKRERGPKERAEDNLRMNVELLYDMKLTELLTDDGRDEAEHIRLEINRLTKELGKERAAAIIKGTRESLRQELKESIAMKYREKRYGPTMISILEHPKELDKAGQAVKKIYKGM
ncbi:MAG: hypothetical protein KGI04_02120 [Candidatus Micrarchaeota archaeon]|nr:hypothetical protein [Candidatus Micrarchaeota archaeon]